MASKLSLEQRKEQTLQDKIEVQQAMDYNLHLATLPKVDFKDFVALKERIEYYFNYTRECQQKPSITSYALALGVNKETIYNIVKGRTRLDTKEASIIIQGYSVLDAMMESMIQEGKVNVVAGIFLAKNHYGYKDQKDVEVTHVSQNDMSAEELRKKYLEDFIVTEPVEK